MIGVRLSRRDDERDEIRSDELRMRDAIEVINSYLDIRAKAARSCERACPDGTGRAGHMRFARPQADDAKRKPNTKMPLDGRPSRLLAASNHYSISPRLYLR